MSAARGSVLMLVLLAVCMCTARARAQTTESLPADDANGRAEGSAQGPLAEGGATPDDLARARVLFQRGVELTSRQDYTSAARRFREALAIHHAPAIAYNLASALSETGAHSEAYDLVQSVLRDAKTPEPLRARAERLEESLQRSVARLTVIVSSEESDVRILVDGEPLSHGLIGVTRAVAPGDHVVLAERAGVRVSERSVRIVAGTGALVDVSLVMTARDTALAADAAAPAQASLPELLSLSDPQRDAADHDKRRRRFWIIGGASVVAVGAGVLMGVLLAKPDERTESPIAGDAMPGVLVWR